MKKNKLTITFLAAILFTCFQVISAQTKENRDSSKEKKGSQERYIKAKNPKASYLDVFHARHDSAKLHRLNKSRIFALKSAVQNFGSAEDRGAFETILKDFKSAVGDRYKGSFVASEKTFRKNLAEIKELYTNLANSYRERTSALLEKCADALVELELQESAEPGSQLESHVKQIDRNKSWLQNGYSQLSEGENMQIQDHPEFSISHYRVAKMYGIGVLRDISIGDAKKKIESEYSVDLQDIKRLVAGKVSAGK